VLIERCPRHRYVIDTGAERDNTRSDDGFHLTRRTVDERAYDNGSSADHSAKAGKHFAAGIVSSSRRRTLQSGER
jgi:hypothetical protein